MGLVIALLCSAAVASETFGGFDFYVGDPHAHTGVSGDGGSGDFAPGNCTGDCADFADIFTTARDNGLDWVAISDHSNGGNTATGDDWALLHEMTLSGHDPEGGFVTLPAAELWFNQEGSGYVGHKTLLLFGDNDLLEDMVIDDYRHGGSSPTMNVSSCDEIWDWMESLTATRGDAMLVPHHTALERPMATDWSCHDDRWQPAVEIYSEHGSSLYRFDDYDPPWSGEVPLGTVEAAIDPGDYGLRLGFMGGSDKHDTRPGGVCHQDTEHTNHPYGGGLTIAYLDAGDEFDRGPLYEALISRHSYATSGPIVPLRVTWRSGGTIIGGLGDELDFAFGAGLEVDVAVPADWADTVVDVQLVGPDAHSWTLTSTGEGRWGGSVHSGELVDFLFVQVELDGEAIYADGECEDGGDDDREFLWTSPSWLGDIGDDYDGDGVSWDDGDCDDGDAEVGPGSAEIWYDGIDQNCDGADDYDQDGDGHRFGLSGRGRDCNDRDATVYPGAAEVWYDGIDQNCDRRSDYDQDRDGWDSDEYGGEDCDDTRRVVHPGVAEKYYDGIDQNCDGLSDYDLDGDGHDSRAHGGDDRNDFDPLIK